MKGWSLKEVHWKELASNLAAQEWDRYKLDDDNRQLVPSSSGIYLICTNLEFIESVPLISQPLGKQLYNAVYVGQAKNLKSRFNQHLRSDGKVEVARNIFWKLDFWYSVCNSEQLNDYEQLLMNALGPPANIKNVRAKIGNPEPAGINIGVHK